MKAFFGLPAVFMTLFIFSVFSIVYLILDGRGYWDAAPVSYTINLKKDSDVPVSVEIVSDQN